MTQHEREVMRMALAALEIYGAQAPDVGATISALRACLAQYKKEWVGLTDEEYELMAEKRVTNYFFNTLDYAHDIEAKLKEKNT